MVKLYKSSVHPRRLVAYLPGQGWMMFPATENGWEERLPARGLDPLYLREVPLHLASRTGLLEWEPAHEYAEVA